MNDRQAIVMASGGLDSTVLSYWAIANGYIPTALFINYGQHCASTELETLKAVAPKDMRGRIEVVNVSDVFSASSSRLIKEPNLWKDSIVSDDLMLPYRNLFLLATGAAFAANRQIPLVFSAFINSNYASEIDATMSFLTGAGEMIRSAGGVELKMPFREMAKAEVVKLGIQLDAPVAETFSCQANSKEHCGSCPNCVERLSAFSAAAAAGI